MSSVKSRTSNSALGLMIKCLSTILWYPSASSYLMPHCLILIQSLIFEVSCWAGGLKYISIYLKLKTKSMLVSIPNQKFVAYRPPDIYWPNNFVTLPKRVQRAHPKFDWLFFTTHDLDRRFETLKKDTYCSWRTFSELNSISMEVFSNWKQMHIELQLVRLKMTYTSTEHSKMQVHQQYRAWCI